MARVCSNDFFLLPRLKLRAQLLNPQLLQARAPRRISFLLKRSASRILLVSPPLQRPADENPRRPPGGENDKDPHADIPIIQILFTDGRSQESCSVALSDYTVYKLINIDKFSIVLQSIIEFFNHNA